MGHPHVKNVFSFRHLQFVNGEADLFVELMIPKSKCHVRELSEFRALYLFPGRSKEGFTERESGEAL